MVPVGICPGPLRVGLDGPSEMHAEDGVLVAGLEEHVIPVFTARDGSEGTAVQLMTTGQLATELRLQLACQLTAHRDPTFRKLHVASSS